MFHDRFYYKTFYLCCSCINTIHVNFVVQDYILFLQVFVIEIITKTVNSLSKYTRKHTHTLQLQFVHIIRLMRVHFYHEGPSL